MSDADELHRKLETLERRLAAAKKDLDRLDAGQRQGLGAWLERISEEFEEHDKARS